MLLDLPPLNAGPRQAVVEGTIAWWQPDAPAGDEADRLLAAVNFAAVHVTLRLGSEAPRGATLLASSDPDRAAGDVDLARFVLLPSEVVLLRLADASSSVPG